MPLFRYKPTGYQYTVSHTAPHTTGGWNALFVSNEQALVVGEDAQLHKGALTTAYDGALGWLRGVWTSCAEGALQLPDANGVRQLLLFHGDTYAWAKWDSGMHEMSGWTRLRLGPRSRTLGELLPADWCSGVDVMLQAPRHADGTWQTYFFKADRVLTLNWATGVVRDVPISQGPDSGAPGWAALPDDFTHGLDHLLALPPAADGTRRSLLIKGVDGLILDWVAGVERRGPLHTLTRGLAQLTGDMATLRQPFSGRYTWSDGANRVDLRIDLEAADTSRVISGELFTVAGRTTTYANSFRCVPGTVRVGRGSVQVYADVVEFARPAPPTSLSILIDRKPVGDAPAFAVFDLNRDDPSQTLNCHGPRISPHCRAIGHEAGPTAGPEPFARFGTTAARIPPGHRHRVLSVASAWAGPGLWTRPGSAGAAATGEG
ncbi:hypothetical protein [Streptomyces uncialis]|uniref:hypothetical protein n=1 Tax=Streptomyces uncialis TaxID=1048205 RepID=UPI0038670CE8|nr:hypothetical protein OG268_34255 [Streptomyces uncialis]